MTIKVFDGSNWNSSTGFKFYNGSSWTDVVRGYVYTGSSWNQFYPDAPSLISSPSVSGNWNAGPGTVLTTTSGTWTNNPTSYSYQWQRGYTDNSNYQSISGATSTSYTTTTSDVGYSIKVVVTATNARGSTSTSAWLVQGSPFPPTPLTGLTGSKLGSGNVYMSWNASTGATRYSLYNNRTGATYGPTTSTNYTFYLGSGYNGTETVLVYPQALWQNTGGQYFNGSSQSYTFTGLP